MVFPFQAALMIIFYPLGGLLASKYEPKSVMAFSLALLCTSTLAMSQLGRGQFWVFVVLYCVSFSTLLGLTTLVPI